MLYAIIEHFKLTGLSSSSSQRHIVGHDLPPLHGVEVPDGVVNRAVGEQHQTEDTRQREVAPGLAGGGLADTWWRKENLSVVHNIRKNRD